MHERELLLLVSKLRVPPWRPDWVARPRLLDRAGQMSGARLLLCAAPAGFGKTTALIAWAERHHDAGAAVAWYALDEADNDPARFAAYLLGAIAQADPQLPLAEIQSRAGADITQLLIALLNLLYAANRPYALALDDYHLIHSPAVHQMVATLIEQLPDSFQLALGTRADPPLPLARLRARGRLAELRAADLQFAPDEIVAFFQRGVGPRLAPGVLERVSAWSEGWAAGLQLLALTLAGAPADTAAIEQLQAHLAGSQRHIFSFLADEVFAHQPPATQAFLLATSVVDELTPELCDALVKSEVRSQKLETGGSLRTSDFSLPTSSLILEQLEHANLFLVRLDAAQPWYRYHHLFRSFLRRRLDALQPGQRARLHRRAAHWYAEAGNLAQAATHAFAGDDIAYAAELIVRVAWEQFSSHGEIMSILSWAARFSTEQLVAAPVLSLSFGQAALMAEQAAAAAHYFALAEQGIAQIGVDSAGTATQLKFLFYQALATTMNGAIGRALELLDRMGRLLPPPEAEPGIVAGHALVTGACAILRGDLPGAYAALERMEQLARQANHLHFIIEAIQMLALADLMAGRLERAERRSADLLARFGDALPPIPAISLVLGRLGEAAYQRGQLERAEELLRQGAQHGRRCSGQTAHQLWYWLVRALAARGDLAGLRAVLETDGLPGAGGGAVLTTVIMAGRAEGLLALGATDEAWQWAQRCAQVPGEHLREAEVFCVARVLLALGRPAETLARLEPFIAAAEQGGWYGHLIELLALQARALYDLGRPREAQTALRQALILAEPAGYVQVFARMKEEGGRMKPSLAQLPANTPTLEATISGLDLHPSSLIPHPLTESLTEREREVLVLLAQGATNQDIAQALVVSVGTVKTHINHILDKLAARNRTEAVARARTLGLL